MEQFKGDAEKRRALQNYEAHSREAADHLRWQTETSQASLKNLTLVNGGAIIAILTFIGNSNPEFDHDRLWMAICLFVSGLASALLGYVLADRSHSYYYGYAKAAAWFEQGQANDRPVAEADKRDLKIGNRFMMASASAACFSLSGFACGAVAAVSSLA